MPLLVINLSSVAAAIFQQQAQIWFFLLAVALFVCFVASLLMNRPIDKNSVNQGDLLAKKVSMWWLVFLLLLIMGFAMPMLRVWLVLMG
jgi:cobalamin synthase